MVSRQKKSKFEYKLNIYDDPDDKQFTEQHYQEALANKDDKEIILSRVDLNPFASDLYASQLPQFLKLDTLKLEYCNLD